MKDKHEKERKLLRLVDCGYLPRFQDDENVTLPYPARGPLSRFVVNMAAVATRIN